MRLIESGLTDREVARRAGVAYETVRAWRSGRIPERARRVLAGTPECARCGGAARNYGALPCDDYAHLLGMYLGDGCIAQTPKGGYSLRLALDVAYPRIMASARNAVAALKGGPLPRRIGLEAWQESIVAAAPEAFLRALIHTDGWRGTNVVHVKGRDYAHPRYPFFNRSEDIRRLFTDVCDELGVAWRPWGPFHISVARGDAVAALDAFIGRKG